MLHKLFVCISCCKDLAVMAILRSWPPHGLAAVVAMPHASIVPTLETPCHRKKEREKERERGRERERKEEEGERGSERRERKRERR